MLGPNYQTEDSVPVVLNYVLALGLKNLPLVICMPASNHGGARVYHGGTYARESAVTFLLYNCKCTLILVILTLIVFITHTTAM